MSAEDESRDKELDPRWTAREHTLHLIVEEVPLDNYECPCCGLLAYTRVDIVTMSKDGVQRIEPRMECARTICPCNGDGW